MSKAYIIEIHDRTAGIVAGDERGFTFFSSDRAFDRLDGRDFRSAREAERAARPSWMAAKPACIRRREPTAQSNQKGRTHDHYQKKHHRRLVDLRIARNIARTCAGTGQAN
jgi:hypothetical protein